MKLKIQAIIVLATLLFYYSITSASASDGRIILKNGNISCEGISIWQRSSYHLTGKCFGLTYPYDEQLDTYVLWARIDNGETKKIEEIDRGIFDGSISDKFNSLFVTAETNSSPRQPGRIILSGDLQRFSNTNDSVVNLSSPVPTSNAAFFATPASTKPGSLSFGKTLTAASIIGILLVVGVILALSTFIRRR